LISLQPIQNNVQIKIKTSKVHIQGPVTHIIDIGEEVTGRFTKQSWPLTLISGTLNGLHRAIGTVNKTLEGLHGTIRTENRTLKGVH
jgi:hypothetical protein